MKWQKKLTKKELAHMKEYNNGTLATLKQNREHQRQYDQENPDRMEACRECRNIARKLGLEEG
jgi:hypothetical protein